jgi:hypothetical protein
VEEIHQTLESKMRQIFLGINESCSNCPRFQIISQALQYLGRFSDF